MRLFALLAGFALLVLAPMISANDEGQSNKPEQIKDRGIASFPRHLQFNDDDEHGSASPTPSPMTTSTCSNGVIGIESSNGAVCCVTECGQCGGAGCSTVGLPDYDAYDCCVTEILDFGVACSIAGTAPCYID